MSRRQFALLLVVVGLLCLPAPLYLGWAAETTAPPQHTSQVYAAQSVDLANETDRQTVLTYHRSEMALSTHQVSQTYSAGEYRAPNVTRRTLDAAMRTATASTNDSAAMADLRRIAGENVFVYDAYAESLSYYRLQVDENGSTVRTWNVSAAVVANETAERTSVRYAALSAPAKRTIDRIVANSSAGDGGYRPYVDDAFVDRLPALVWKNGTLYSLHARGHVDDLGPGFAGVVAGVVVAGVGVVLVLVGGAGYVVSRWRESREPA